MAKFNLNDIQYRGETNGVHSWVTSYGQPYYWHPDWLHVAEDEMGQYPTETIDVAPHQTVETAHAFEALVKYLKRIHG